jgi:hypothetical protein
MGATRSQEAPHDAIEVRARSSPRVTRLQASLTLLRQLNSLDPTMSGSGELARTLRDKLRDLELGKDVRQLYLFG